MMVLMVLSLLNMIAMMIRIVFKTKIITIIITGGARIAMVIKELCIKSNASDPIASIINLGSIGSFFIVTSPLNYIMAC